MVKWTEAQQAAIDYSDSSLLVSAAAGSGKTAVLVERIIKKVTAKSNPLEIDEILVSTFTNKAAEEMRNRIGLALKAAMNEAPDSKHLRKQLSLLQKSHISTLHAFCMTIVRQYAYLIDVDPAFRIADEMEIELLRQETLDDLLEEAYQTDDGTVETVFQLADMYSNDRDDEGLGELILQLFFTANESPWPEEWLKQLVKQYEVTDDDAEETIGWLNILKNELREDLQMVLSEIASALDIAQAAGGPEHYVEMLENDQKHLQSAYQHIDEWDQFIQSVQAVSFQSLSRKKSDCDPDLKEKVKQLRDKYKKYFDQKIKPLCKRDLASHLSDLQVLKKPVDKLVDLTLRFDSIFKMKKKDKAILDFSDLEHLALNILLDANATPENIIYSNVAKQYQAQFKEVYVDEYQDINLVQETIIQAVSDPSDRGNLFMVGDVKQSIYRFRSAEPRLFIEKYIAYETDETVGKKIDLAKNFRSRQHILTGANYIFRQLFDQALGEIDYNQAVELIYGNFSYDDLTSENKAMELVLIEQEDVGENIPSENQNLETLLKSQLEARLYAKKIKTWLGNDNHQPMQVFDKEMGQMRDLTYRDIVILKRSTTSFSVVIEELKKQGIPAYAELKTGYFDAIEIKVILSLLKIIDNPYQDIPLASVLRSPIVGLTEEELARVRIADKRANYYDAMQSYLENHAQEKNEDPIDQQLFTKLKGFESQLAKFRALANETTLSELIWTAFLDTGYYDFVGGIPGGRQRQANLRALYDRARGYERSSYRGLYRFLRFIERMEEERKDLGSARALSEEEDVVRIMTIHKSKGLEFPVVILGSIEHQFNQQDVRRKYIMNKDLDFASKFIDPDRHIMYPTLYFEAAKKVEVKKSLAEEMRVLYVALTRAKEKLVMVGSVKNTEKTIEKWQYVNSHQDWVLPLSVRKQAKSYLDWIGPALVRHQQNKLLQSDGVLHQPVADIYDDPSNWDIEIVKKDMLHMTDVAHKKNEAALAETIKNWEDKGVFGKGIDDKVAQVLAYQYPHRRAMETRAKESVTEIKRRQEQKEAHSNVQFLPRFSNLSEKRPKFLMAEKVLSRAEIGTAMHAVMQHLPLETPLTTQEISQYIDRFILSEKLTEAEGEAINIEAIVEFLNTSFAKTYLYRHKVEKEVPFTYMLPAQMAYPDWENESEERLLIQGIVDCLIHTPEGLIILDYKTDQIDGEVDEVILKKLMERYRLQMEMYQFALEDIYRQPIQAVYLYYFSKGILIKMNNV